MCEKTTYLQIKEKKVLPRDPRAEMAKWAADSPDVAAPACGQQPQQQHQQEMTKEEKMAHCCFGLVLPGLRVRAVRKKKKKKRE